VNVTIRFYPKADAKVVGNKSGCSAAWLARYLGVVEVVGSNPASPTFPKSLPNKHLDTFRRSEVRRFPKDSKPYIRVWLKKGGVRMPKLVTAVPKALLNNNCPDCYCTVFQILALFGNAGRKSNNMD